MKRSVFLFWLYSNLAVLLIPIVIAMVVLYQSRQLLVSEVIRSNEMLLHQVQQSFDYQFRDIKNVGLQLSTNPKVVKYVTRTEYDTPEAKLDTIDMITTLRSYGISNGSIEDMYVFMKKQQFGVSTSALNESKSLFEIFHEKKGVAAAAWNERIHKSYFGSFVKLAEGDLVYMQSVPLQNVSQDPQATLVVMLNAERIKNAIAGIQLAEEGSVLILDSSNQALMTSGAAVQVSTIDMTRLTGKQGTFLQKFSGVPYTISYVSSGESDWRYVSILPSRIYAEKVDALQLRIYIGLALCVLVGGGMTLWLTRKNYMPIRRMVDQVSPKVKAKLKESGNEFTLLQSFMAERERLHSSAQQTIEKQQLELRGQFLARLLKGRVESGEALTQSLELFGLQLEEGRFAVMLFHIGDFGSLFKDNQQQDAEARLQFVHHIVTNITEEMIRRQYTVYSTEADGMLAFLVRIQEGEEAEAKQELQAMAAEAQAFILERFYIQQTIGISNIHHSVARIPQGYDEAREAIEYKFVIGPSHIIPYDQIKRPAKSELYYPLDTERQLINYIKTGQYEQAMETVGGILAANVSDGQLTTQLGKLLMFELIGTILKSLENIPSESSELSIEKNDLLKLFTQCESFAEMEDEIYRFVRTVCEYIESKKKSHNTSLAEQVLDYIEAHLADMNLSLTALSLEFELNAPYLSRFFKEQTGQTFIDYVNLRRVELAKKLLTDTNDTIADITLQVGFTNSNTFIRVFKRYEGITPGQYRKGE